MGVVADIHLTTYLYLQPGLMLTTKGGKEGNSRLWLGYFELPVLLSLGLPINNEVNVRFNAGPTIAMGTVSVKSQNYLNGINLFAEDYGLRRFNAGLIIGGGVELGHLYLGLFYEFGLYNISHDGDLKTNSLAFALGHNF